MLFTIPKLKILFLKSLLNYLLFTIIYFLCHTSLIAQNNQTIDEGKTTLPTDSSVVLEDIDVNFLFHYYEQDGNHSAVTGGLGTEELQDISGTIILNIPLDTSSYFNMSLNVNHYSSASTDRINTAMSSASSSDVRTQVSLGYKKFNALRSKAFGFHMGGSMESDYISNFLGADWMLASKDGNREFNISGLVYFDRWAIIFPEELREAGLAQVDTDKRRSYSILLSYSQVINKKMQVAFSGELVNQNGLLSTPFHRVYFREQDMPKIEKLPGKRFKIPLSTRLHYYIADPLVLRMFYRYYWDDFGIRAHTISIEPSIKFSPFFSIYPFYRYHTQQASQYFGGFKVNLLADEYYTSDFDLSGFYSHKAGIGFRYSPVFGISRFRHPFSKKIAQFKSVNVRYAQYKRQDGLIAFMIGTDFAFSF